MACKALVRRPTCFAASCVIVSVILFYLLVLSPLRLLYAKWLLPSGTFWKSWNYSTIQRFFLLTDSWIPSTYRTRPFGLRWPGHLLEVCSWMCFNDCRAQACKCSLTWLLLLFADSVRILVNLIRFVLWWRMVPISDPTIYSPDFVMIGFTGQHPW